MTGNEKYYARHLQLPIFEHTVSHRNAYHSVNHIETFLGPSLEYTVGNAKHYAPHLRWQMFENIVSHRNTEENLPLWIALK